MNYYIQTHQTCSSSHQEDLLLARQRLLSPAMSVLNRVMSVAGQPCISCCRISTGIAIRTNIFFGFAFCLAACSEFAVFKDSLFLLETCI